MMLRLDRVRLREVLLPLREPFRISSGEVRDRRILLVEVAGEGAVGWGECVAGEMPSYGYETVDTAWHALTTWLVPALLGKPFSDPQEAHELLEASFRGHRMAKASLEMAAWCWKAEAEGRSLSRTIGGSRVRVGTGISIGIQASPEALAAKAVEEAAKGYRKIKLKIAPGEDLAFVEAVREALPEADLMVDANSAYRLVDGDHLSALDRFELTMIEQPLDREDLLRHAALQRRLKTPICLDESITSLDRAEDMAALGAGRIVNIKPGRVGGFAVSRAIHDFCAARKIPVWCGGMLESGIGRAHNVALASLEGFVLPGDLSPSARYWRRDLVEPEWTMDGEGYVRVPLDRPGLGVEVDRERIEALTVRRWDSAAPDA